MTIINKVKEEYKNKFYDIMYVGCNDEVFIFEAEESFTDRPVEIHVEVSSGQVWLSYRDVNLINLENIGSIEVSA